MILFGVNFSAYFLIISGKLKQALHIEEIRWYLAIIAIAIITITINVYHIYGSIAESLQQVSFQVASIITTTGFATTDFNTWPEMSRTILVILMFVGACAGSTGGGVKVSRFVILMKTIQRNCASISTRAALKRSKWMKTGGA